MEISYFEIYNEKIHDLLAPSKKKDNKKVQVNFYSVVIWKLCLILMVLCLIVTSVLPRICKLGIQCSVLGYIGTFTKEIIFSEK